MATRKQKTPNPVERLLSTWIRTSNEQMAMMDRLTKALEAVADNSKDQAVMISKLADELAGNSAAIEHLTAEQAHGRNALGYFESTLRTLLAQTKLLTEQVLLFRVPKLRGPPCASRFHKRPGDPIMHCQLEEAHSGPHITHEGDQW